jgi:hypothetical protein
MHRAHLPRTTVVRISTSLTHTGDRSEGRKSLARGSLELILHAHDITAGLGQA